MNFKLFIISILLTLVSGSFAIGNELDWPLAENVNKPWSRWWWMGNAVDKAGLENQLKQFAEGGLGGVEICPIYGVKGYEDKSLEYLSPKWLEMFDFTLGTARSLGMEIDLTCGTGWPFGGPQIDKETASTGLILKKYTISGGETLSEKLKEDIQLITAVSDNGKKTDLTNIPQSGQINWTAPAASEWTVYIAAAKTPMQKVKRAAPGSEGYVVNPYSVNALDHYLSVFDKAFAAASSPAPRCFFHDSFEYYGADWSSDFFEQFQKLRGYDLREHIAALAGDGPSETVAAVSYDYRQTISKLHINWVKHWDKWCNSQGSLSRNQAHGAPANLLDLYGAADIPETEIFRHVENKQIPMLKFASSAAHLNGGKLASAEAFTWLSEHFQTPLAKLKEATDFLLISGINHVLFHGIPYSPAEAQWPGWQFYASVNFSPQGGLWHDLPAYNAYVTRCQSMMQAGESDEEILLYFPIADFWQKQTESIYMPLTVHNNWMDGSKFFATAEKLLQSGWAFDYVSDDYLQKLSVRNGKYLIGEKSYSVILVPDTHFIPLATMEKLSELAKAGGKIVFESELPTELPGLEITTENQDQLQTIAAKLKNSTTVYINTELSNLPKDQINIIREECVDFGIDFMRRKVDSGYYYFMVNRSDTDFNGWLKIGRPARSYVLMNPLYDNEIGIAKSRIKDHQNEIHLQLKAGESVIIKALDKKTEGKPWQYYGEVGESIELTGNWQVDFIYGGPELPAGFKCEKPALWTNRGDESADAFAGTASYKLEFDLTGKKADYWMLNLGKVHNSARVFINGKKITTLWSEPFEVPVGQYLNTGINTIEIQITNLAANRIRNMDITKVNWKYFNDINVVNIDYKPFDSSGWPILNSGLVGPVKLIAYTVLD